MRMIAFALAAGLLLQGCSSRPREFAPSLAQMPADQAKYEADLAACRQLLAAGKLDSEGRLASAAVGAGAAAAMGTAGGLAASSAGLYAGAAVASMTVVLIPIVGVAGAYGMAKKKQRKKEAAIQRAMTGCLEQRGYQVIDWKRARSKPAAAVAPSAK